MATPAGSVAIDLHEDDSHHDYHRPLSQSTPSLRDIRRQQQQEQNSALTSNPTNSSAAQAIILSAITFRGCRLTLADLKCLFLIIPLFFTILIVNQQNVAGLVFITLAVFMSLLFFARLFIIHRQIRRQFGDRSLEEETEDQNAMMELMMLQAVRNSTQMTTSLNNIRLAMIDRDFTPNDYDMLLSLDENRSNQGLPQYQIDRLPTFTVPPSAQSSTPTGDNTNEKSTQNNNCAVCLENKVPGEVVRSLPCLHSFHQVCIDPWLQSNASCPVCKFRVVL